MEGEGKIRRRDFLKTAAGAAVGSLLFEAIVSAQPSSRIEDFDSLLFEEIVTLRNSIEGSDKKAFAEKIEEKLDQGIQLAKKDKIAAFEEYLDARSSQNAEEKRLLLIGGGAVAGVLANRISDKPDAVKAGSIGALGGAAVSLLEDMLYGSQLDKDSKELTPEEQARLRKEFAQEVEKVTVRATKESIDVSLALASSKDLKKLSLILDKRVLIFDEQFPQYSHESPLVKYGIVLFLSNFKDPDSKVNVP